MKICDMTDPFCRVPAATGPCISRRHWHHARFDLASGCTFDLWADDVPTCAVELRADGVWVQPDFWRSAAAAYWRQRLQQGLAQNLGLVIAKAIQGQLAAGVSP